MVAVILYQPEIPPNTGNIIRLCANAGCALHLVGPLGFDLDEPKLRRAGLDYREWVDVRVHESLEACLAQARPDRVWAFTRHSTRCFAEAAFGQGDALLFGAETRGLPEPVIETIPGERRLALPMRPGNRSLNLSNAVAIAVYEAWRQTGFEGAG